MLHLVQGLLDRIEDDAESGRPPGLEVCKASITRDLEALLNSRLAWPPAKCMAYPEVAGSVLNYGLNDFAALCVSSESDQQRIAHAVRHAIERHEPRLRRVGVSLHTQAGAINRVDFIITAELNFGRAETMQFNAVFCPSQQRYAVEATR